MPNLKTLVVRDSVDQTAPFGELQFVPGTGTEYQAMTELTDAENQERLPVINQAYTADLYINNVFQGTFFPGVAYITHSDDFADPDQYVYRVTVTGEDPRASHRRKTTCLFSSPDETGAIGTMHDALNKFSRAASSTTTLNVLPNFKLFGTLEWIETPLLEAMNQSAGVFNTFGYAQYYVRYRNSGLEYIFVDYTKTPRNPYTIPNIKSIQRSYERYSNNALIGDQDVIVSGGERIKTGAELELELPNSRFETVTYTETQTYTSQSTTQSLALLENWVENETVAQVQVQLRKDADGVWVLPPNLSGAIADLKSGMIDDIRVLRTDVLSRIDRQYNNIAGLSDETVTAFSYEDRVFNNGILHEGSSASLACDNPASLYETRRVLVADTTTNYIFPDGERIPTTMTRKWYLWNAVGVVEATVSVTYTYFRDAWVVTDIAQQVTEPMELLNATIEFWTRYHSETSGIAGAPPVKRPLPALERWRVKNGVLVTEEAFRAENCTEFDATDLLLQGFELTVPASQKDGLLIVSRMADRQKEIERGNPFWETVTVVSTIDLNIYVSMPVSDGNRSGYVVGLVHEIDEDVAQTTTTFRFLHV